MNEDAFSISTFYDLLRERFSVSVRQNGVLVHHSGAAEYLTNDFAYEAGEIVVAAILGDNDP